MKDDKFRIIQFSVFFQLSLFSFIITVFIFIHSCTNKENQPAEDYLQALVKFEPWAESVWMASHFKEPEAQWAERRLSKQILYRQAVNGDGRFVRESCRDGFYVEAVQALMITAAYFHNKVAGFPSEEGTPPENHISHYPDIGLIVQRSDKAMTTVSYGARTMSLVYPLGGNSARQQFITSPNPKSVIGTDGKTQLKSFSKTATGFKAELELNGVKSGRKSKVSIISEPDAVITRSVQQSLKWEESGLLYNLSFGTPQGNIKEIHVSLN